MNDELNYNKNFMKVVMNNWLKKGAKTAENTMEIAKVEHSYRDRKSKNLSQIRVTNNDLNKVEENNEKYLREMGAHWSREIMEGAVFPPTLKTERKFDRKGMMTGTFGMEIKPFLKNAELADGASEVVFECTTDEEFAFPLQQAESFIFKFSQDGKPLLEDGPVHVLFADGSNVENPIKNVRAIRIQ